MGRRAARPLATRCESMRTILAILLFLSASTSFSRELVLHVDVKFKGYLDIPRREECSLGKNVGANEVCVVMAPWRLYSGKVKSVISGSYNKRNIKFALLSDGGVSREYSRDMYVRLNLFKDTEKEKAAGTEYFVEDYSFPERIVCFDSALDGERVNTKLLVTESKFCYQLDDSME